MDEMHQATSNKHYDALKLMIKMMVASKPLGEIEWSGRCCANTAKNEHVKMLKWLKDHNFP